MLWTVIAFVCIIWAPALWFLVEMLRWRRRVRARRAAWWWQHWLWTWKEVAIVHYGRCVVVRKATHAELDAIAIPIHGLVRYRSNERTDVCTVWNPDEGVWEESDIALRARVKRRLAR